MNFNDKKVVSEDAIKTLIGIIKDALENQSDTISNIQIIVNGKQDALTAGTAISLTNNTVGVKVGSGLSVDANGVLNAQVYNLPIASDTTLGGIKVGTGLGIDNSGVLSNTRTIQEITAQEVDSLWDSIIPPTPSGDFSVAQAISSGYDDGDFGIATQDT